MDVGEPVAELDAGGVGVGEAPQMMTGSASYLVCSTFFFTTTPPRDSVCVTSIWKPDPPDARSQSGRVL
jgi:hypothetical protein